MVQLEHAKARECCLNNDNQDNKDKDNDINDTPPKELHQLVLPRNLTRIPLHIAQACGWHGGRDPQDGVSKVFVPPNIPPNIVIVPDDVFYSSAQRAIPESTYGDSWGWQMWIAKHPVNEGVACAAGESEGVYPVGITTRPAVEVNGDFIPLDRGQSHCFDKGKEGWKCYDDHSASVYAPYKVEVPGTGTDVNATNPRCYSKFSTVIDFSRGSSSGSGSANSRNEDASAIGGSQFRQQATMQNTLAQASWRRNDLSRHDPGEGSSRGAVAMSWRPPIKKPTNSDNEPYEGKGQGRAPVFQPEVAKRFVFRADTKAFVPGERKNELAVGQAVDNDTLASREEPVEKNVEDYVRAPEALEEEHNGELPPSQAGLHSIFALFGPVTLSNNDVTPESSASGSSSASYETSSTEQCYSYEQYPQDEADYIPKYKDFDANKAFLPPSPTKEQIEEAIAEAKAMAKLQSMQEKQRFTESQERTIRDLNKEVDIRDAEIRKLRKRIAGELEDGGLIAAIYDEKIVLKKERDAIKMKYEALKQDRDAIKKEYEALKQERVTIKDCEVFRQERDEVNKDYEELRSVNGTNGMNMILEMMDIKALRMSLGDQEAQIDSLKESGLTSTLPSPPISVGSMGEQSNKTFE